MKFSSVLDGTLVQEWRSKYVDYDDGKRRIKTIEKFRSRIDPKSLGLTHNQVAYIDSELEDLSIRYTPNHISRTRVASISQPTTFNSLTRSSDNEGFRSLNSYAANTKMSSLHKRSTSVPDNALMSSNVFIRQSYVSRPEVEDANFIVLRLEQETFASWFAEQLNLVDDFYEKTESSFRERLAAISAQLHEMKFSCEEKRDASVVNKLKLALQELYRAIELLRSYTQLNRTAFQKILKKYTKAVQGDRPPQRLAQALGNASFVVSDFSKISLHTTEDLYAHYFQQGDRKIASGKLRRTITNSSTCYSTIFRCGLYVAVGTAMFVQGLVYAIEITLNHPSVLIRAQAGSLLQLYAGYFLALYLFVLFNSCCFIWQARLVNYQFVFELNPADRLDWRALAEYPTFFYMCLGIALFLNFSNFASIELFLYWPIILVVFTGLVIFWPGRRFHYNSRRWWAISHFRLLTAVIYQVEFRDVFLGDMYISLTYFTSNIPFLFCLYTQSSGPLSNPAQCSSSSSVTMGFFAAIPAILRFLQCLKRYADSREAFPHLVNALKYVANIAVSATLSQFRIQQTRPALYAFIAASTINMLFATYWDLVMDWHLLQRNSSPPLLRDIRNFRFTLIYYLAMLLDPLFRSSWVLLIFFSRDARVSFIVAFIEVTRRGLWMLFRVENEHCVNVGKLKSVRDIPLPYNLPTPAEQKMEKRKEFVKGKKRWEKEEEARLDVASKRSSGVGSVWTTSRSSSRSSSVSSRLSVGSMNSTVDMLGKKEKD